MAGLSKKTDFKLSLERIKSHLPSKRRTRPREETSGQSLYDGSAGSKIHVIYCFKDGQTVFHEQTLPDY